MADDSTLLDDTGDTVTDPAPDPKPVDDKPVDDKPPAPVDDKPVDDKPVDDKPVDDKDKPVDDKPKDDDKDKPKANAPEKYELTLADETQLESGHVEQIEAVARELDLDNAQAQVVTNAIEKMAGEFMTTLSEKIDATANKWAEDTRLDAEFGGGDEEKFKQAQEIARKPIATYADEELKGLLGWDGTRLGNNKAFFRMMYRIGLAMRDDPHVPGGKAVGGPKTHAERLYPDMAPSSMPGS